VQCTMRNAQCTIRGCRSGSPFLFANLCQSCIIVAVFFMTNTRWRNYYSAYLILPMGLLLIKFTYCKIVSALTLPIILVNRPVVTFA